MNCKQCGSENTQKLSIAYSSGLSKVETKTTGVGVSISGGSVGLGFGKSNSIQQTQLSRLSKPPVKFLYGPTIKKIVVIWIVLSLTVTLSAGLVPEGSMRFKVISVVLSFGLIFYSCKTIYNGFKYNKYQYPELKSVWVQRDCKLNCVSA